MNKILKLTILISFLYSCNNSASKDNDWLKNGLKGNVKSIKSRAYEPIYKFGKLIKGVDDYSFDSDDYGNSKISYNSNGDMLERECFLEYSYRVKDNKRKIQYRKIKTIYTYDKGVRRKKNQYDSYGNDKKVVYEKQGVLTTEEFYTYDNFDNKIKDSIVSPERPESSLSIDITTYKYNNSNDIIEVICFEDPNATTILSSEYYDYKYDNKGNLSQIQKKHIPRVNSTFWMDLAIVKEYPKGYISSVSDFDINGNKIMLKMHTAAVSVEDGLGNEEAIVVMQSSKFIMKYDNFNNITEEIIDSQNSRVLNYEYKFDSHNNWIEKIVFVDNVPERIIEREISYF